MEEPDLSGFAVALCGAEEAGNVGSACRAMKTMGLGRLILAGCPDYDDKRVAMMAVHAFDVYQRAERFPDLQSALAGFSLSAGFTRRRGERRKAFSLTAEEFADRSCSRGGSVALVFGNERTGLTGPELGLCSLAVHIPVSDAFPSLNLAQAVQIACYELRRRALAGLGGGARGSSREETAAASERMAQHLRSIGFFKVTRDRDLTDFLRDTAERAAMTVGELRYFESIFRKASGMIRGAANETANEKTAKEKTAKERTDTEDAEDTEKKENRE